ncbi:hypothetical protein J6590_038808 [Homalodisca vitripennis]|nr:hypothetical protein J6590_038808 [Homalodisca vitripennis]
MERDTREINKCVNKLSFIPANRDAVDLGYKSEQKQDTRCWASSLVVLAPSHSIPAFVGVASNAIRGKMGVRERQLYTPIIIICHACRFLGDYYSVPPRSSNPALYRTSRVKVSNDVPLDSATESCARHPPGSSGEFPAPVNCKWSAGVAQSRLFITLLRLQSLLRLLQSGMITSLTPIESAL